MKILRDNNRKNIIINQDLSFRTDLGWEDSVNELEYQTLRKIINPIENYETVRYIHEPYDTTISGMTFSQTDIWFYFYFLSGSTYVQDYEPTGLSANENALMRKQVTESFFRLEFFKTRSEIVNDIEVVEPPSRLNRRLVFSKNLSIPLGEKYFYTTLNDFIYKPAFVGSNYRNKENMYFFWFQDETALNETSLTGNTFWMTAKFYNAEDGTIVDFVKSDIGSSEVNETNDMYYKVVIDKTNYSYQVFRYNNEIQGTRVGESVDPIKFYQKKD
jgi:hypothetical protein